MGGEGWLWSASAGGIKAIDPSPRIKWPHSHFSVRQTSGCDRAGRTGWTTRLRSSSRNPVADKSEDGGIVIKRSQAFTRTAVKGKWADRVRNGRGLCWTEKVYRKFLSEELHVGYSVVDLAQHALQILTGYPKHIHTFGQEIKRKQARTINTEDPAVVHPRHSEINRHTETLPMIIVHALLSFTASLLLQQPGISVKEANTPA